jgi:hypothetical protein
MKEIAIVASREWLNDPKQETSMTDACKEEEELLVTVRWKFWKALLQAAGRQIDPETAEVDWTYIQIIDPYGVLPNDIVEENDCVGRGYFARAPGSDLWIEFGDLPEPTREALWRRRTERQA